jgi:hypothetical protein
MPSIFRSSAEADLFTFQFITKAFQPTSRYTSMPLRLLMLIFRYTICGVGCRGIVGKLRWSCQYIVNMELHQPTHQNTDVSMTTVLFDNSLCQAL